MRFRMFNYDNRSYPDLAEILLKAETLICGEYDGETAINSSSQQDAVAQALQPLATNNCGSELTEIRLDLFRN
jgi:hypothetical protein